MFSDTEEGTRAALETDVVLEAERTAQIEAVEQKIAAEEAGGKQIAAVMAATHAKIATLTADHNALERRKHDASIDGTETDPVAAAREIRDSADIVAFHVGKLKHLTENRQLVQRLKVLTSQKERAVLVLDRAGIRSRVHASQLLLAVLPAGKIGGDLTIKSEQGMRLAHEESQAAYDLEAATNALAHEIEQQQKIRDARTNRGPITYQNP